MTEKLNITKPNTANFDSANLDTAERDTAKSDTAKSDSKPVRTDSESDLESMGSQEARILADTELPSQRARVRRVKVPLTDMPIWKAILVLSAPVMVEQLLTMLVGLVDVYLTGQFLTADHMAAIGIMSYLLWTIPSIFGAVSIGTLAIVSRSIGAGDTEAARTTTNQAITMGLLLSSLVTMICWFQSENIVAALQLEPAAANFANEYFRWIIPVIPLVMCQQVGTAALRGAGDTLSGSVAMGIVNITNVFLSYALMTGSFGLPKLGWQGVAVGTMSGYLVGGVIVIGLLLIGRRGLKLSLMEMIPRSDLQMRLLRVGLPGGSDMIAMVSCQLGFLGIVNSLGTIAASAHALALRLESLAYLPCNGFNAAVSALVGQFLGAKKPDSAARTTWSVMAIAIFTMLAFVAFFLIFSSALVDAFLTESNAATARLAAQLLIIIAWGLPSLAVVNIVYGALRGAGDTRGPLWITLFCFLIVRMPLAIYLSMNEWPSWVEVWMPENFQPLGLGVAGAWYSMVADLVIRSGLSLWRFSSGQWRDVEV